MAGGLTWRQVDGEWIKVDYEVWVKGGGFDINRWVRGLGGHLFIH